MQLCKISELFNIEYGHKFDMNKMTLNNKPGIAFVSRSAKNNGISAFVKKYNNIDPLPAGMITVALGGAILASFVQDIPFYTAQNIAVLNPRVTLTRREKLFYCLCITKNKFRYSAFGREANRTFKDILVPKEIPKWVYETKIPKFNFTKKLIDEKPLKLRPAAWKKFRISDLFELQNGKGLFKVDKNGTIPIVTSTIENNGIIGLTSTTKGKSNGPAITISIRGGGNAFLQEKTFIPSLNALVLKPKFELTKHIGLFLCVILNMDCFKFSYGRIRTLGRVKSSNIKLPVTLKGRPDWQFMEEYMKRVPGSGSLT